MEYNSQKEDLVMPEYGRNVQQLVNFAKEMESDVERQAFVEKIVDLMQQMHPQNRNIDDYRVKLWKHVFRIAGFDLPGVTLPNGEVPSPEKAFKKPDPIPYPQFAARFRHYGHHVQRLIKKAISMEDGPVKEGLVNVIGSYMKLAYRTWNKEHYVSDDVIKGDLDSLSNSQLAMNENASLDNLSSSSRRKKRGGTNGSNNGKSHRSKGKRRK